MTKSTEKRHLSVKLALLRSNTWRQSTVQECQRFKVLGFLKWAVNIGDNRLVMYARSSTAGYESINFKMAGHQEVSCPFKSYQSRFLALGPSTFVFRDISLKVGPMVGYGPLTFA